MKEMILNEKSPINHNNFLVTRGQATDQRDVSWGSSCADV